MQMGADWFERHLLDHDVCSNYGEWASMANVAAAPTRGQPLGLKGRGPTKNSSTGSNGSAGDPWKQGADIGFAVFDPWEQAKQYDKTESYVRRWLPELRLVPDGYAHQPHLLSQSERKRASCFGYPTPLALEPFQYARLANAQSSNGEESSSARGKHRRVEKDNSVGSMSKNHDVAAYPNSQRPGWREDRSSYYARARPSGRRWHAKDGSTRAVYLSA